MKLVLKSLQTKALGEESASYWYRVPSVPPCSLNVRKFVAYWNTRKLLKVKIF